MHNGFLKKLTKMIDHLKLIFNLFDGIYIYI